MIRFTILGQPVSMKNRREVAMIGAKKMDVVTGRRDDGTLQLERMKVGGRILNRKSDEAAEYERTARLQIPHWARVMLAGEVRVTMRIYYASRRSDLDESLILDIMQARYETVKVGPLREVKPGEYAYDKERRLVSKGVYLNDRQVWEKHVFKAIDEKNPRAEIEVEEINAQLFAPEPVGDVPHETTEAVPF